MALFNFSSLLALSLALLLVSGTEAARRRRRNIKSKGLVRKGRVNKWYCNGVDLENYLVTQTDLSILPQLTACARSDVTGLVLNRKQRRRRLNCVIVVTQLSVPIGFNLRCTKGEGWLSGRVDGMPGRSRLEALTTVSLTVSNLTAPPTADEKDFTTAIVNAVERIETADEANITPSNIFVHLLTTISGETLLDFSVQGKIDNSACVLGRLLFSEIAVFREILTRIDQTYVNAQFAVNSFTLCKKCFCPVD